MSYVLFGGRHGPEEPEVKQGKEKAAHGEL
jgi:hypothetical protein